VAVAVAVAVAVGTSLRGARHASAGDENYGGLRHTETWPVLSEVKGVRFQSS
jgi:hypothetical protein